MDMTSIKLFSTTSISPCVPGQIIKEQGDCVESGVEEWLEDKTLAGFRVWQLAGIIISILITITVGFCCCIRFRIPRTKQEIEADWIRKKITRDFRQELNKIADKEMDEMNLRGALEKVRIGIETAKDTKDLNQEGLIELSANSKEGIRTRFSKMFRGMHARFNQVPPEIITMT